MSDFTSFLTAHDTTTQCARLENCWLTDKPPLDKQLCCTDAVTFQREHTLATFFHCPSQCAFSTVLSYRSPWSPDFPTLEHILCPLTCSTWSSAARYRYVPFWCGRWIFFCGGLTSPREGRVQAQYYKKIVNSNQSRQASEWLAISRWYLCISHSRLQGQHLNEF